MKIRLERIASDSESTIGIFFIDGVFQCFTLEDEYRATKVPGETRIPAGAYRVSLRVNGGLTKKYAARYPDIHRGMLWLQGVPGFEWIYIHVGNRDEHTEGCILVGDTASASRGDMSIGSSVNAYRRIYPMLADAAENGDLEIEIIDRDR